MIFRMIGFILALSLFLLAAGSVFMGTVGENLLVIGALLLLNILIAVILPRIFKLKAIEETGAGIRFFGELVNRIVVGIVLVIVYVFGVGVTWLFSRLTGKKFLNISPPPGRSTWVKREKSSMNFDEMF